MSDNEDWRRRKAEELGLIDTGPWLSRPLRPPAPAAEAAPSRAPHPGAVRPPAQDHVAERDPAPIRTLSEIPDDAMYVDRWRSMRPQMPPSQSAASPSVTLHGSARHTWRARAATMLAIAAGLALALVFGWWLRGAAAPADIPLVIPTTATPPSAEYAPATVAASPAASPPAASSPRAKSTPPAPRYSAEDRARAPMTTGEGPALHADRPSETRARLSASRGRFTAPRAVAALGRDFSPSFNCRRATSWVNRMVCNDRELAALDVRMSDAYGGTIATAGPAGERRIDAEQAHFLEKRSRCRNAACINRVYRIRIDELALQN